ncbi:carbohydrate-binding module family 50 protein [Aaosphaeria arxii CBS 175.79]|uniref:Carbohydrate-binding module family 50 protein n=1 Tax=Aaosphaeria arxii CBS 175.79 TaxID=1450172 RepID=A0A6A5Y1L1_9PLEO|nr:carbohydrate-binding module family 50 protein [Aaosphaeria arxii CBS 175.79]KAF2019362.1 carbohydrate-binding module family 50 protein [Aaosphaeria arxii CBS 175.79]
MAMHPTNGSPSSKTSSTPVTSTLRPRTRRLISIEDEYNQPSDNDHGTSSYEPRAGSPAVNNRASRSFMTTTPTAFVRSASAQASKASRDTSNTLSGFWGTSLSAIQGLTANVLGNDPASADASAGSKAYSKSRGSTSAAPPKKWGPSSSSSHVGAGTQDERERLVRAMKRKDLLTANEHILPDSVGRIKRRNSDERISVSAPPGEGEDRDALVYIHHVRPQDTLAGLSIKYNCEQAVLRKANRMWPNDSIQIKRTIMLPVDACGVKGRPVDGPNSLQEDLLLDDYSGSSRTNEQKQANSTINGESQNSYHHRRAASSVSNADSESPWKTESWVLLPNDTSPTEIGRISRRALGFFPPARRKSIAFSDATPTASLDLPRSSTSTNPVGSPSQSKGRASSRTASVSRPGGRQRSNSQFSLHGPGGVGTMGRNVRSPGPAQDGLNKLFASHLPNVAPPPGQEYFTPWAPSLLEADSGTSNQYGGGSGARTPLGGPGIDLQEIGGAIEGWVRKVGTQASKLLNEPGTPGQGKRSAVPVIGAVGGDLGDLIELRDDAFDSGDGERGRSIRQETLPSTMDQYQSARPDINLVMRDRTRKSNSSKKD